MPSPHRRVGLIVDEPVDSVLRLFPQASAPSISEAGIVRRAVLEGGLVEALVRLAAGNSAQQERAALVVEQVRELMPSLRLDTKIKEELLESLGRVEARPSLEERRRRQLALMRDAKPPTEGAQTAADLADTFDAFARLPAR
jgi:hypothetical protein